MKNLYLLLAAVLITNYCLAQDGKYTLRDYAKKPVWINMMDDTSANFFQVELAFTTYFKHHEKPEGEEAEIGEYREREKIPSKRKQRKLTAENKIKMQVKRYELWHNQTLPYVRDDGHILTPSERLAILHAQQAR